jgi:hypothetical protein
MQETDGPPAWRLGVGLTLIEKKEPCYDMLHRTSELDGFFGKILAKENGYIWFRSGTSGKLL